MQRPSPRTSQPCCEMQGIDQAQLDAILRAAALDYQKDRGQSLIERAFGGNVPGGSE